MILRALITSGLVCLLYGLALRSVPESLRRRGATTHQANCIRAEQLIHSTRLPDNVVVGTSLLDMLQPEMLGPEFGSLALAGGSTRTGLEIVHRSRLRPKRLFVETNFLPKQADPELLGYLYDEPMSFLRSTIPLLRQSHQPVNLFFSLLQGRRAPAEIVAQPRQLEVALQHHARSSEAGELSPSVIHQIEEVRGQLERLQQSGIEIVLVEMPVHPAIAGARAAASLRARLVEALPPQRFRWLRSNPGDTYMTTDGLHLVTADARRFAAKVRAVAGLAPETGAHPGGAIPMNSQ